MTTTKILSLIAAVIFISACTTVSEFADNAPVTSEAPEEITFTEEINITEKIETEEKEIITVSPLATEDFLLPFDSFSFEMTEKPEYVMLHFTSAVVLSKDNPYDIEAVRDIFEDNSLSIHYIIDREGKIRCWMPESRAAWHAGNGTFANDEKYTNNMNRYSIGIEMLAIGSKSDMAQYLTGKEYESLEPDLIGYTDAQYESLRALVRDICQRNSIPFDREHIIGHEMYNPAKSDPGELFSYDRLFAE